MSQETHQYSRHVKMAGYLQKWSISLILRNLQETTAESARTDCTLSDPSLAGKTLSEDQGKNVNYNCEANATQGDASTANFTLNTDVPMTMVNANGTAETLDFAEVNFNGDAADESTSLQTNTQTIQFGVFFVLYYTPFF